MNVFHNIADGTATNLFLQGMQMGPMDPKAKVPAVGQSQAFQRDDPMEQRVPKFMNKERSGFSGGFKIPEEHRRARLGRQIVHHDHHHEDEHEDANKNDITKDEIM